MEKQSFGQLFKSAWKRSGDGRFKWLALVDLMWVSLLLAPLFALVGATAVKAVLADRAGEPFPIMMLLWAIPLGIVLLIGAAWLSAMVNTGVMREALYPAPAQVGRAFANGFARWKTVLYPLPWLCFASIVSSVTNNLVKGAGFRAAASLAALGFAVNMVVSIVTNFLYCGVAVEDTRIAFAKLYSNAIAAFKNGWGRFVVYYLAVTGMTAAAMLSALPGAICLYVGLYNDSSDMTVVGFLLLVAWLVLVCFYALKIYCFSLCFIVSLYTEACGPEPEDGAPEAPAEPTEPTEPTETAEPAEAAEATEKEPPQE